MPVYPTVEEVIGRTPLVRLQRLDHLRVDAQDGVQRHHRILEDHRDAIAAQRTQFPLRQTSKVPAFEPDASADDRPGRVDETEYREASH